MPAREIAMRNLERRAVLRTASSSTLRLLTASACLVLASISCGDRNDGAVAPPRSVSLEAMRAAADAATPEMASFLSASESPAAPAKQP